VPRAIVASIAVTCLAVAGCSSGSSTAASGGAEGSAIATTHARPADAVAAAERVPSPTVTGPVGGGIYDLPFNPMPKRLADRYGYTEQEFFVHGTATSYTPQGVLGADGRWSATPAGTAPYETRLLVRRPADPGRFNGTVIVEWLNVTSAMDQDADFGLAHEELLRDGYAYVAVSAQAAGVSAIPGGMKIDIPGFDPQALKQWDPSRYGALQHPGDDYSYDLFTQAGQAIRRPNGVDQLGGLKVERVIATGESQSAMRMLTHVDAVHPLVRVYDGFMIHSRGSGGAALSSTSTVEQPKVAGVRTDLAEPVMQFETETDVTGLGFAAARQPDTDLLRSWEVAGTSHADQSSLDYGFESGRQWNPDFTLDFSELCGAVNRGPQTFVLRRAFADLTAWVAGGPPPATGPQLSLADATTIARDRDGNALGGIRTPAVDVPLAMLSGDRDPNASLICSLFGRTTPLPPADLVARYPSRQAYVDRVAASAQAAVDAGFVLPADKELIVARAGTEAIGSGG